MLVHIDNLLWVWGDWVRGHRVGGRQALTMNYRPRGVMTTNLDPENPTAERLDKLIAALPPYMKDCRRAVTRKYWYAWREEDAARDMKISRSQFVRLIDRAHHFLAAKLPDCEKEIDVCVHMN